MKESMGSALRKAFVAGRAQGGVWPAPVMQNDIGNRFSPAVITTVRSKQGKANKPHILLVAARAALRGTAWRCRGRFVRWPGAARTQMAGRTGKEKMRKAGAVRGAGFGPQAACERAKALKTSPAPPSFGKAGPVFLFICGLSA